MAEESIIGQSGERVIKIPIRSIKEYRFVYGENSPGVSEGNGEQQPGDVVQKGQQEGQGQGQPGDQAGNEVFETDIHLMDLIDIMFEDLELPDLERKGLKKIMSIANKRPRGHVKTGIRARLDKRKTAKNRIKRRWATTGPRTAPKSALKDEPRFPFHRDDMRYHKAIVYKVGDNINGINPEDTILYDKVQSHEVILDNERMTIIQERDVVCVFY